MGLLTTPYGLPKRVFHPPSPSPTQSTAIIIMSDISFLFGRTFAGRSEVVCVCGPNTRRGNYVNRRGENQPAARLQYRCAATCKYWATD